MKIPDLERIRVDFAEGGMLSDRRVYLRLIRERLVFDVCAAPFGTSFFFSCRQAEIPTTIKLWHLVVFGLVLLFSVPVAMQLMGTFLGPLLLVLFWIFFVWLCRNAIPMGLTNLDGLLIRTPVIGPLYERFLRRETYYRVDTRLMYLDTVNAVVKKRVETTTAAGGGEGGALQRVRSGAGRDVPAENRAGHRNAGDRAGDLTHAFRRRTPDGPILSVGTPWPGVARVPGTGRRRAALPAICGSFSAPDVGRR
jgi:hypothetical protein